MPKVCYKDGLNLFMFETQPYLMELCQLNELGENGWSDLKL